MFLRGEYFIPGRQNSFVPEKVRTRHYEEIQKADIHSFRNSGKVSVIWHTLFTVADLLECVVAPEPA